MLEKDLTMLEIEKLKETIEKGKTLLGKAEGRLEGLLKQENDIKNKIKELGIEPDKIEEEIQKLENEIKNSLNEIKNNIPLEYINSLFNKNNDNSF